MARKIHKRAGSQVVDQWHIRLAGYHCQVRSADLGAEALNAVVGGVDLEDDPGLRTQCLTVILRMGAVGRADLDQLCPSLRHYVGHAERPAYFDQLATRHDSFTTTS